MVPGRSSAGAPARTLQLLWRGPVAASRRGPERGLDVDAVVAAATD
ncbi:MAG: TetR/AcrR family transcriptional regulator, partial [Actinomycetota bacterium]|nr:TetR/AcrR family transcriptional regulator [Actinomycetota bacterium]